MTLDEIIEKIDSTAELEKKPKYIEDSEIENIFEEIFTYTKLVGSTQIYYATKCGDMIIDLSTSPSVDEKLYEKESGGLVVGKWVAKVEDRYCSHFKKSFEYKLNEIARGEDAHGLYVALPSEKAKTQYSRSGSYPNSVWIDIEVFDVDDIKSVCDNASIQITKGKVIAIHDDLPTYNSAGKKIPKKLARSMFSIPITS